MMTIWRKGSAGCAVEQEGCPGLIFLVDGLRAQCVRAPSNARNAASYQKGQRVGQFVRGS
jgi:hypothetical protein